MRAAPRPNTNTSITAMLDSMLFDMFSSSDAVSAEKYAVRTTTASVTSFTHRGQRGSAARCGEGPRAEQTPGFLAAHQGGLVEGLPLSTSKRHPYDTPRGLLLA
jgi:hypothetical protein